jgi:hypothetical protein
MAEWFAPGLATAPLLTGGRSRPINAENPDGQRIRCLAATDHVPSHSPASREGLATGEGPIAGGSMSTP